MMTILYDLAFFIFSIIYLPYLLVKRKWHKGFAMRFGFLKEIDIGNSNVSRIWIHAVSVGEVVVIKNLLNEIRLRYPENPVVITVVTQTGFEMAQKISDEVDQVIYAPLDFSLSVRRYIDVINPRIYINAETELWPNLLTQLYRRGVPIVQVNGRISDQALKGYRFLRPVIKPILNYFSFFCMQSNLDADRIKELGACSERVKVVGNMKFDDILDEHQKELSNSILDESEELFVAGSTHPGEEEIVLDIFKRIEKRFENLRLIIAPRHPERTGEIIDLVEKKGFKAIKFSQVYDLIIDQQTVVVVDTIGHLRSLYRLAKVVFVGKSLTAQGGHNIIEPAYFEKPIIVGPYMQNFKDITALFLQNNAIVQVKDKTEFAKELERLLEDPVCCEEQGRRAREVIEQYQGASEKTLDLISTVLSKVKK
ncbi:MAG: 3-deoxy-D-manno-octulosonic acid transferase [Candidatus Omnitrophica bacterium]|nr:3-deoxy-D-manno-octulosonic acid transferase [Candidatus Omnitrophota bacterium]